MIPQPKQPVKRPNCGTPQGHRKHITYGEQPCMDCCEARGAAVLASKISRHHQKGLLTKASFLGRILLHLQEHDPDYYEEVRAELRPEVADACMNRARTDV